MERHKCKLCLRSFSNGRALGGHMRSHMMNLSLPPKPEELPPPPPLLPPPTRPPSHEEAELASSSSEQEGGEEKGNLSYGLRENPKKSIRLVDPEFPFTDNCGGSVILQDRESETESSKNPNRRRSKRARKSGSLNHHHRHYHHHQITNSNVGPTESWTEPEPLSSISDATTEEDVAVCLMMLSRDKWTKRLEVREQEHKDDEEEEEEEDEDEDQTDDEEDEDDDGQSEEERIKFTKMSQKQSKGGKKYKCETCNKVFRSYQALGGHRASHKKIKLTSYSDRQFVQENNTTNNNNNKSVAVVKNSSSSSPALMAGDKRKIHECPVCFRVFSSGQALGGHKRSHVTGLTATVVAPQPPRKSSSTKFGDSLIDLNLPAPIDEDDVSQIELSAVSDAEFVNPFRQ